eukprot:INCI5807.2.p1 GENE.INCI5807.2~~INCI5807.2.p1  ORF type:complete len:109 (+),score=39.85 INCI5807.2:210-536(+)
MEDSEKEKEKAAGKEAGEGRTDWMRFREGSATVLLQSPKPASAASQREPGREVFFNPLQKLQRDLSVAVARQFFASQHAESRTTTSEEVEDVKSEQQVQQQQQQQQQQ